MQLFAVNFISLQGHYMFRVLSTPIIRSALNCIYNLLYRRL